MLADPSARLCTTRDRNLNCGECGVRVSECNDDVDDDDRCLPTIIHPTTPPSFRGHTTSSGPTPLKLTTPSFSGLTLPILPLLQSFLSTVVQEKKFHG